jgi:hypothetical protein
MNPADRGQRLVPLALPCFSCCPRPLIGLSWGIRRGQDKEKASPLGDVTSVFAAPALHPLGRGPGQGFPDIHPILPACPVVAHSTNHSSCHISMGFLPHVPGRIINRQNPKKFEVSTQLPGRYVVMYTHATQCSKGHGRRSPAGSE